MREEERQRLLAEYANAMNRHGVYSQEAIGILDQHNFDAEFLKLARTSRLLKLALMEKQLRNAED